jgi:hypothetical protein
MQLIQTVTVGSGGAASIDFTSIPATFTDLVLVVSARTNRSGQVDDQLKLTFNGSTSGYSERGLGGNGSGTFSFTGAVSTSIPDALWTTASNATANTFGNAYAYIPNYAGSTAKSVSTDSVTENNATAASQAIIAGLWTGTDAISSITLAPLNGSSINQYSSASLFGILKGSDGIVTVS